MKNIMNMSSMTKVVGDLMRLTILYDKKVKDILGLSLSPGKEKEYADKMFMLGFVHDIGFFIDEDVDNHNIIGGLFLKKQGYPYWKEVYSHMSSTAQYASKELDLLNYAICHLSNDGDVISFKDFLDEIEKKFGGDSIFYQNVLVVVNDLRKKGYSDIISPAIIKKMEKNET